MTATEMIHARGDLDDAAGNIDSIDVAAVSNAPFSASRTSPIAWILCLGFLPQAYLTSTVWQCPGHFNHPDVDISVLGLFDRRTCIRGKFSRIPITHRAERPPPYLTGRTISDRNRPDVCPVATVPFSAAETTIKPVNVCPDDLPVGEGRRSAPSLADQTATSSIPCRRKSRYSGIGVDSLRDRRRDPLRFQTVI